MHGNEPATEYTLVVKAANTEDEFAMHTDQQPG